MYKEALKEIFSTVFRLPIEIVGDELNKKDVQSWDSVGHMALISAIEKSFNLELSTEHILALDSFKKAQNILESVRAY